MKKTMAYTATAILLGFVVMMLPLAAETKPHPYPMQPDYSRETLGEESPLLQLYGLGKQPLNLLPSSLVFFSGLIIALSVYTILKRRII